MNIHPKVKAGVSLAALVAAVSQLLSAAGVIDIPQPVQDALVVIGGFVGGYLKSA